MSVSGRKMGYELHMVSSGLEMVFHFLLNWIPIREFAHELERDGDTNVAMLCHTTCCNNTLLTQARLRFFV